MPIIIGYKSAFANKAQASNRRRFRLPERKMEQGKVKCVNSGDTLVITDVKNPSLERVISLAYVTAPRFRREGDEAFAFESRDFLRALTVGKVVRFKVLYTIPAANGKKIELARVWYLPGKSLPEAAVAEGWLKIREKAGRSEDTEEAEALLGQLKEAEEKAKAEYKGLWSDKNGDAKLENNVTDPKNFLQQWKGKPIDALVERVLSGDRLSMRLLLGPQKHLQTIVLIGGVRAPMTKRNMPDGKEQPGEEGGEAAKSWLEDRILQRYLKIEALDITPQNQIIGSLKHPNGNIAELILREGLGWCQDKHSTLLGADMAKLRDAQKTAKEEKKGLFKGHTAARGSASGNVEAHVSKIQSADTIYIRNKAGVEKRVSLSSVRQPKPTDPKQAPFVADAKEFLRKKLIGKSVKVSIDATRPASDGFDAREMATIILPPNQNVGLLLVSEGWASVIRHRRDDEDRSPIYDELLVAEETAQKEQKGMWSPKPPPTKAYVDASETLQKAKIQLSVLQRQKRVPAIVDYVKSGARFTVLVPKESAKLTFVLSGIRAPRSARNPQEASEPFGQEAHDFANRRCNQRDVEIDVETTDKNGGFIGTLYINRESFAKVLVEEGLATVHRYSAEQSGHATELFAAEKRAKEARKNIWRDWDPSQDEEATEDAEEAAGEDETPTNGTTAAPRKKDYRDIMVTHIDPTTAKLKVQQIGSGTTALTSLMTKFKAFHISNKPSLPIPPKAGDFVAARFSADGEWYRARIRSNDRANKVAEVVYIDYGNSEKLAWSALRPLGGSGTGTEFHPQTGSLRAQATDAVLSLLQFPTAADYLADAVAYLAERTADRKLVANVDYADKDGTLYVTVMDGASAATENVNADVISEGLAMVPRKLKAWEKGVGAGVLKGLREREEKAKEGRRGMWEYGDLTED